MDINIYAVFIAAVLSLILAAIWYGPAFGEVWLRVIGAGNADRQARDKMQKEARPLYAITFALTVLQVSILAQLVAGLGVVQGVLTALLMWLAFVMPTLATTAMWNNDTARVKWTRFLLQAGYQLVCFAIFGIVLALWA